MSGRGFFEPVAQRQFRVILQDCFISFIDRVRHMDCGKQGLRIRVQRIGKELLCRRELHQLSVEHDAHAEVTNRMNGKSEMTELTPTLASFFLTSRSTLTLKYFANAGKGGLIYVVNTITTDSLSDSTVKVYNSDWTLASPADQFKFHNPGSYNHVTVSDADNVVRVKEVIRPLLFEGESREDKPDVVTEYTVAVGNKK